jgi:hypothetical protein
MNWPLDHPIAFGTYTLVLGLLIAGVALFYLHRGLSSRSWPTIEARVTASGLEEDSDGQFSVTVTYTYSVSDETYARTETLSVWLPTRENAERVLREHPVGGAVEVRYDPSRPRVAVLRPGASVWLWLWLAIGIGVAAAGVAMLTGTAFVG